jgi:hypothetical protein
MKTYESRWSGLSFDKLRFSYTSFRFYFNTIASPVPPIMKASPPQSPHRPMIFLHLKGEYQKFYNGYTKLFEGRYCEEYRSNDCFLMMHRKRNESWRFDYNWVRTLGSLGYAPGGFRGAGITSLLGSTALTCPV